MTEPPTSSCCNATSRSFGSPGRAVPADADAGYVEACDLLQGPTIREATIVATAGSPDARQAGRDRRPAGRPPPVPALRSRADERRRAHALAEPARSAPGSPLPAGLPASGCRRGWSTPGSSRRSCFGAESRAGRLLRPTGDTSPSASRIRGCRTTAAWSGPRAGSSSTTCSSTR